MFPGGGIHSEELGVSVQPASQNLSPISEQNLQFSLPYSLPLKEYPVSNLPYS